MTRVLKNTSNNDVRYLVQSVSNACMVLEAFRSEYETLRLTEIAKRCQITKPMALRLLYTLAHHGLVERHEDNRYQRIIRMAKQRRFRFGYASQTSEFSFSRLVSESVARAASEENIDLFLLDNRYSPKAALRNAEVFVRERVD